MEAEEARGCTAGETMGFWIFSGKDLLSAPGEPLRCAGVHMHKQ